MRFTIELTLFLFHTCRAEVFDVASMMPKCQWGDPKKVFGFQKSIAYRVNFIQDADR